MSKEIRPSPSYRRHQSGQAFVTIDGRNFYLGKYGSAASHKEYNRLNLEWLANGRSLPRASQMTVVEVAAMYKRFAKTYYVKNSAVTREYGCIVESIRKLTELYGRTNTNEFGPVKLHAVRQAMIEAGWSRKYINKQCGRLVRMFKWADSKP